MTALCAYLYVSGLVLAAMFIVERYRTNDPPLGEHSLLVLLAVVIAWPLWAIYSVWQVVSVMVREVRR